MTGVNDGEMVAVKVVVGMTMIVAVGRSDAIAITSGDGDAFCEEPQETTKKINIRKKYFIYQYEKSGSKLPDSRVKCLHALS
jgi:hypothetical protein